MSRFHHGRDDIEPGAAPERLAHTETDAPAEMVDRLLERIVSFYKGRPVTRWMQDQRAILEAITWPAVWLNQRGIGMPAADYEARMNQILETISRHGAVAEVRYFPAYLLDCIRKHFVHQGEEIYEARKHVRNAMDLAFLKGSAPKPAQAPDVVAALLQARAVLAATRKAKKQPKPDDQPELF